MKQTLLKNRKKQSNLIQFIKAETQSILGGLLVNLYPKPNHPCVMQNNPELTSSIVVSSLWGHHYSLFSSCSVIYSLMVTRTGEVVLCKVTRAERDPHMS